ncbi:esterase/lipase family protein [Aeoliella sp. SH292]|uniref:esterase/lipase family protein n=1 Tax=Aeoliella sp. SH292 TaxID=3454464 RepID=UPI003F99F94D
MSVRGTPRNPLESTLHLVSWGGPKPTDRTSQVLRRFDLESLLEKDLSATITRLQQLQESADDREIQYSIAELAYIAGKKAEPTQKAEALSYYGTSLIHAYDYLFDERHAGTLNPYDPQFRGACDLYNQSLEATLRIVQADGTLRPGTQGTVRTLGHQCTFDVVMYCSGWHAEDFDNFKFVSDYQLAGLRNHYHTYGLGVPIIAERRSHEGEDSVEKFYPDKLTFPLTAFLRIDRPQSTDGGKSTPKFVLELHDPLARQALAVNNLQVPLESDLSTPLAYFLNQPDLNIEKASTLGLINPGAVESMQGLYMLEPYDPKKMPVVMVHGLWSSPVTWMEMFNDLRSDPYVRQHYQFWFYLYPTGQPFWISAAQMRRDMAQARTIIDPEQSSPALDQMVLVGHSMGGLVSKLQSIDSGDQFWATMSDKPFDEIQADPQLKQEIRQAFFFQPNPSVRRVVTLGTPHGGSKFANDLTQFAGNQLIRLPMKMLASRQALLRDNQGFFRPDAPLDIRTSLDSLDPESVLLTKLRSAEPGPWVSYHNIAGRQPQSGFSSWVSKEGDGVVSLDSARLDGLPNVKSQLVVEAEHMGVHRHPQSVLEVRRILFEQLTELERFPMPGDQVMVASAETTAEVTPEVLTPTEPLPGEAPRTATSPLMPTLGPHSGTPATAIPRHHY